MPSPRLQELFARFYEGNATTAEIEELRMLLAQETDDPVLSSLVDEAWANLKKPDSDYVIPNQAILKTILEKEKLTDVHALPGKTPRIFFVTRRYIPYAAALFILLMGAVIYTRFSNKAIPSSVTVIPVPVVDGTKEILPGRITATLTLGDGSVVLLDSVKNGVISNQNGARISLSDNTVIYDKDNVSGAIVYNTMTTPRGGQYKLSLPDGTAVWLNAASSITYPTAFNGSERNVSITGEAYFEVAKNASMPFVIKVNKETTIRVLGTQFNVNAYTDEPNVMTTLVEGSVRIQSGKNVQQLLPGQQLRLAEDGELALIKNPDVQQVTAWKDGIFNFHRVKLEAMMRQLSRWYDVEIVYPNGIPDMEFGGKVQRSLPLSKLLEGLGAMDVRFEIGEGKKLIVLR
jgi:hypothetical protein